MASMLMECPECHALIAKTSDRCPECRWTEKSENEDDGPPEIDTRVEFAIREQVHNRNYLIFMGLKIATGVVGVVTAVMWVRFIYMGNVMALIWVGFLTLLTMGLGVFLTCADKVFPTDLHCPKCDFQLDKIGMSTPDCPSCGAPLK